MKNFFLNFIVLNPYRENLKSPQTKIWLISIGLIIFLMSFSEGFIWASLFNFYYKSSITHNIRVLLCASIGTIIFILLWLIDSTFALLDTSESPKSDTKWYKPSKSKVKFLGGFITRVILVGISLYTTIPAMTKLTIADDIEKYIQDQNNLLRTKKKIEIDSINNIEIRKKDSLLQRRKIELINEVSGKEGTKRYGDKAAAKVIREVYKKDSIELVKLKEKNEAQLKFIDTASINSLSSKYGIVFHTNTAGNINTISELLTNKESYRQVENICRVYVVLLFIGLLLLKIFAPRSVKIYLNEELQDLYKAFKNNQINSIYFANFKNEFDNEAEITPYRFYEFWSSYYYDARKNDLKNLTNDEGLKDLDNKISKFNQQKNDVERELAPVQEELLQETEKKFALEEEKMKMEENLKSISEKIKDIKDRIDVFKSSKTDILPEDLIELSKQHMKLLKEEEELKPKINSTINEIELKAKRIMFVQGKIDFSNKELLALQDNLNKLIEFKHSSRNNYFESLND